MIRRYLGVARVALSVAIMVVAGSGLANPNDESGPSECLDKGYMPLTKEEILAKELDVGLTHRELDPGEVSVGLDPEIVMRPFDEVSIGIGLLPVQAWVMGDSDGDCLADEAEEILGTDPGNPDSDGDGWYDGPCNERRKLVLKKITAEDEQEDSGEDEFYLIVDDVRFPNGDLDDWWDFDDGDSRAFDLTVATRVRGKDPVAGLKQVEIEGWEDDYEIWNEWVVDDLLFASKIDLGAANHGDQITVLCQEFDWVYRVVLEVQVEYFEDPSPLVDSDDDGDGIAESDEFVLSRDQGGLADPWRSEVFVEVDAMKDHSLHTNAKRLISTQFFRHDIQVFIIRDEELAIDDCLSVPEARNLYHSHFSYSGYNAFRYAVIGEELWNDAFGATWFDTIFIDDTTWFISGDVLAQTAAFFHQLGHTMSLRKPTVGDTGPGTFRGVDENFWLSYESAMNYTYSITVVDYSHEGSGGESFDHNDWDDVDPAWGLDFSFGSTTDKTVGQCGR